MSRPRNDERRSSSSAAFCLSSSATVSQVLPATVSRVSRPLTNAQKCGPNCIHYIFHIQENSFVRCDTSITNCFPNRRYRTPSGLKIYIQPQKPAYIKSLRKKCMSSNTWMHATKRFHDKSLHAEVVFSSAKRCARKSIHHPTKMCSETPCSTTGTPSSGLADRRAHHCGMRVGLVQVPMSHHTYTLGIHLRNSATVEPNLSVCGKP